ncbi:PrsW family intramembrane metalloprotease [Herbidospora cretacea]|uniref:PrsW family intramembrane metalloprotease n=1 Tax=Herbidospora cretacea TaxID=28444 RepID=UPI000774939D|nr:PrsW family intramembrane metalloprotease [Herbidospora cretacea]
MTRRPAFWVWLLGVVLGVLTVWTTLVPQARVFLAGTLIALGVLVPVLLLAFWLFTRIRPVRAAPTGYSWMALAWGGLAAFGVAFLANTAFSAILTKTTGPLFADRWADAIAAPLDEETAKLAGVALIALIAPWVMTGALAGFGYGAIVGLGFQIMEDFLYVFNTIIATGGIQQGEDTIASLFARLVYSAWWSHWAMTAVAGAGLGYAIARTDRPLGTRVTVAVTAWVVAMLMHAWWDSPLLPDSTFGKGVPLLVIAIVVFIAARHLDRRSVAYRDPQRVSHSWGQVE